MTAPARKRRIWSCATFALHAYGTDSPAARTRARRFLLRLDARHGGRLLIPSEGCNRRWTFYAATLFSLEPDLAAPVESLEFRLDAAEEALDELGSNLRATADQVRQNSRDVARVRAKR